MVFPVVLLLVAGPAQFAVEGRVEPPAVGSVTLHAATSPFTVSTLSGVDGRFRFKGLEAGSYTLSVFIPNRGEQRRTVVLSPSTTDAKGRMRLSVALEDAVLRKDSTGVVSMRELSIPSKARDEYRKAQQRVARNETEQAVAHLERAVELAPNYSEAWNHLGTIAYHAREYERAERMFRKALLADESSYPPLVNMGGVLLNLGRPEEAWNYNVHAVLREPGDALAHSQLGMTYLALGKLDLAEKSLREAIRLDPAHFSYPQIHLAEVYVRKNEKNKAADALDEFLKQYPDHENAARIKATIQQLRAAQ